MIKKIIAGSLIATASLMTYAMASDLSLGDFLDEYVDHFAQDIPSSYQYIDVYYTNMTQDDAMFETMQQAIYLNLVANVRIALDMDILINQSHVKQIVETHFGHTFDIRFDDDAPVSEAFVEDLLEELPGYNEFVCGTVTIAPVALDEYTITSVENFPILEDVYQAIKSYHIQGDSIDSEDLVYGAIKGLSSAMGDRYTVYRLPSEYEESSESFSGEYEGIGIVMELIDEGYRVTKTFDDGPAQKGGLLIGDIIISVDGKAVADLGSDTVSHIKGPAGTQVTLTIIRDDETLDILLERAAIVIDFVSGESYADITYVRVDSFSYGIADEVEEYLQQAVDNNDSKIILDMRDNPGGLVTEASQLLSYFFEKNDDLFSLEGPGGNYVYDADDLDLLIDDIEVVVLVNNASASASEIVALVLQEAGIATVIGEQTFGKGVAQRVYEYYDGSALQYTSFEWFSSINHTSIQDLGVTPDIFIVDDIETEKDEQLEKAVSL